MMLIKDFCLLAMGEQHFRFSSKTPSVDLKRLLSLAVTSFSSHSTKLSKKKCDDDW